MQMKRLVLLVGLITALSACGRDTLPLVAVLGDPQLNSNREEPGDVFREIAFTEGDASLIGVRNDGSVELWSVETGEQQRVFQTQSVFAYASRAGAVLAKNSSNEILLVSLSDGSETVVARGDFEHGAVAADATRAALSAGDDSIEVWDLTSTTVTNRLKTARPVSGGLRLSADGAVLAAAEVAYSDDTVHATTIEAWRFEEEAAPTVFELESDETLAGIWNLRLSPDGGLLAADIQQSARSGLRVWGLPTGDVRFRQGGLESYWARGLGLSSDASLLVAGDEKGLIRAWDVESGEQLLDLDVGQVVQCVAFSSDGTKLAAGLWDATVRIWELPSETLSEDSP